METKNEDLDLYMQTYKEDYNDRIASNVEQLVRHQFPGIKELEITYENGLKLHYNDDRYLIGEVYGYITSLLKTKLKQK